MFISFMQRFFKNYSMFKMGMPGQGHYRCCFCLHVRTAAIAFGVWHLLLHVLALTVLALVMRNHSYFNQRHEFEENDFLPTPLSKVKDEDNPYYLPTTQDGRPIMPNDVDMGAIMTICTLSITLLMVYGAIKGRPKQILPFLFLQLFDLSITILTATGYFCYFRSVHRLVAEHWHNLPFRQELLSMSPQNLSLLVMLSFVISICWKFYWINVIFRCYKYLLSKQRATHNTIHYILPSEGSENRTEPDYVAMFRDNEPALYGPMKQTPPPSYQDVMDEQPPPYPSVVTATVVQELPVRRFLFTYAPDDARESQNEDGGASTSEEPTTPRPENTQESPVASCSGTSALSSPKKDQDKQAEVVCVIERDPAEEEYAYVDVREGEPDQDSVKSPAKVMVV